MDFRHRRTGRCLAAGAALADPVGLTPDMMSVTVETAGGPVEIMREQDNDARRGGRLDADLAALSEFLHPADDARRGRDPGGRAGSPGRAAGPQHRGDRRSHPSGVRGRHHPRRGLGALYRGRRPAGRAWLRGRFRRLDLRRRPAAGGPVLQRSVVRAVAHGGAADDRGGLPGREHQLLPWRHAELEHAGA
jgi:hypothetical protein